MFVKKFALGIGIVIILPMLAHSLFKVARFKKVLCRIIV
jgi:hypothetical protein